MIFEKPSDPSGDGRRREDRGMYHPSPTGSLSLSRACVSRRAGPLARARARTSRRPRRLGYHRFAPNHPLSLSPVRRLAFSLSHRSWSPSLTFLEAAFSGVGRLVDPGRRAREARANDRN